MSSRRRRNRALPGSGWRRIGQRRETFKDQFRFVLASQVAYAPPGTMLKMQLEYVAKYFGPPDQYFHAVACAPYFSPGKDQADVVRGAMRTDRQPRQRLQSIRFERSQVVCAAENSQHVEVSQRGYDEDRGWKHRRHEGREHGYW